MSIPTTNDNTLSMRRCVPLAREGLVLPDMRVNYTFGLVLGEAEFQQEQTYFLTKDYLHNRALHGYGTVSGLSITIDTSETNDRVAENDARVTVERGLGVDQLGRTFAVRNPQCADIGAWLAKQEPDAFDHQTGDAKTIYVVAYYDECEDALVPIAGQPCSTGEENQAASRIRDSVKIELRTHRPAMPSWDALQLMADLLYEVRLIPNLDPELSDEADILSLLDLLDSPAEMLVRYDELTRIGEGEDTVFQPLRLPSNDLSATLDRIFTHWITQVRPKLAPDLIAPDETTDPAILLTTIRFEDNSSEDEISIAVTEDSPDDTDRPYLMHTQAIQQLLALGNAEEDIIREFATLNVVNENTLTLWIHHPDPLVLPAELGKGVMVIINGTETNGTVQPVEDVPNVFNINTTRNIPFAARVTVRLSLNDMHLIEISETPSDDTGTATETETTTGEISTGEGVFRPISPTITRPDTLSTDLSRLVDRTARIDLSSTRRVELSPTTETRLEAIRIRARLTDGSSLLEQLHAQQYQYVGREGDFISVHTFADNVYSSQAFASVTTLADADTDGVALMLWIHDENPENIALNEGAITVSHLTESGVSDIDVTVSPDAGNNYRLALDGEVSNGDVLRVRIDASRVRVNARLLTTRISNEQRHYTGYDGTRFITIDHVVNIHSAGGGGDVDIEMVREVARDEAQQVTESITQLIETLRTMEFVTITPMGPRQNPDLPEMVFMEYELWFHVDLEVSQLEGIIEFMEDFLAIYLELGQGTVRRVEYDVSQPRQNIINVRLRDEEIGESLEAQIYARFAFALDSPIINGEVSLREYMEKNNLRFLGNFAESEEMGGEVLLLYSRIPQTYLGRG